jgi:hypothetical protein
MKEKIALASPPAGFAMDPIKNQKAAAPEPMKPFPAATPVVIGVSLDDLIKGLPSKRVLQAKGGLDHRFNPAKVAK